MSNIKYIIAGPEFKGFKIDKGFFGYPDSHFVHCLKYENNQFYALNKNGMISSYDATWPNIQKELDNNRYQYIDESEIEKWIDKNTWEYIFSFRDGFFDSEQEYCFKINRILNKVYFLHQDGKLSDTKSWNLNAIDKQLKDKNWKIVPNSTIDKWLADFKDKNTINKQIKSINKPFNFDILLNDNTYDIYCKIFEKFPSSIKPDKESLRKYYPEGEVIFHVYIGRSKGDKNVSWDKADTYRDKSIPLYNGETQLGEIIKLIEEKPAPTAPEIHGYKCEYKKGEAYVKFGCAVIKNDLFVKAADLFSYNFKTNGCNREVDSIILDSGKTFNLAQIKEVINYINKINEE